jgi:hypothetical protein
MERMNSGSGTSLCLRVERVNPIQLSKLRYFFLLNPGPTHRVSFNNKANVNVDGLNASQDPSAQQLPSKLFNPGFVQPTKDTDSSTLSLYFTGRA